MEGIAQDHSPPAAEPAHAEAPALQDRSSADEAAFALLVDRHARFLYRVAFGLLKNHQDAEDAVQDTLFKLYRTGGWRHMDDERAFLARSVWRSGLDRLSTAGARAMKHSHNVADLQIASPADTPEQHAVASSERRLMRTLIQALPETLRQPLVLSAVEGMRSQEVAAILGIPESTVRTRVMRARAELRERFLALQSRPAEARS